MSRFMMQALGKVRPLSFDLEGRGQPVLQSSRTLWAGIPFEVHDMPASETDWECAPLPGERAITILVEGSRKYFASRREYSTIPGTVIFPMARATSCSPERQVRNVPSCSRCQRWIMNA